MSERALIGSPISSRKPALGHEHAGLASEHPARDSGLEDGAGGQPSIEGVVDILLETVELFAGLGFLGDVAAGAARLQLLAKSPPRLQRPVASGDFRLQVAVGEI